MEKEFLFSCVSEIEIREKASKTGKGWFVFGLGVWGIRMRQEWGNFFTHSVGGVCSLRVFLLGDGPIAPHAYADAEWHCCCHIIHMDAYADADVSPPKHHQAERSSSSKTLLQPHRYADAQWHCCSHQPYVRRCGYQCCCCRCRINCPQHIA